MDFTVGFLFFWIWSDLMLLYMLSVTLLRHPRGSWYAMNSIQVPTPQKSGLCVWNRNEPNQVHDGNGRQPKQLPHIDWKISGIMIKVYNTRSYSALAGWTNCRGNVIGGVWLKICCHGNSVGAQSLLQHFGLVLDKRENQVTAKIKEQWSENRIQMRDERNGLLLSTELNCQPFNLVWIESSAIMMEE